MMDFRNDKKRKWRFSHDSFWTQRAQATLPGATHGGVAINCEGNIYCSTDGPRSVIVFDHDGNALRQLDARWSGIHSLQIVEQAGEQFLLCSHLTAHRIVMLTMDGQLAWSLAAPMESGLYQTPGDFKPTAAELAPDGSLYVADGYGASVIHQFDERRNYVKSFGGADAGEGRLCNCHGLALDTRGPVPLLLICDRRNRRLVHFDLSGNFAGVVAENLRRPCGVAFHGDHLAVAELEGRVSILDGDYRIIATLGDNPDPEKWANYEVPPEHWQTGILNAPHSVAFDHEGNLYVQEWNRAGRLSKFLLLSEKSSATVTRP